MSLLWTLLAWLDHKTRLFGDGIDHAKPFALFLTVISTNKSHSTRVYIYYDYVAKLKAELRAGNTDSFLHYVLQLSSSFEDKICRRRQEYESRLYFKNVAFEDKTWYNVTDKSGLFRFPLFAASFSRGYKWESIVHGALLSYWPLRIII